MGWVFDVEQGVKRVQDVVTERARPEPVLFRGVDCAVLAERYVAYRREKGLDVVIPPLDLPSKAEVAARLQAAFETKVAAPAEAAEEVIATAETVIATAEMVVTTDTAADAQPPAEQPEAAAAAGSGP